MSKVAAVSGAIGEDLQALRDKAREMGVKTKFLASEAAEAMNYMAMAVLENWRSRHFQQSRRRRYSHFHQGLLSVCSTFRQMSD